MVSKIIDNVSFGNPNISSALVFIFGYILRIFDASINVSTVPGFLICFKISGFPDSIPICKPIHPLSYPEQFLFVLMSGQ